MAGQTQLILILEITFDHSRLNKEVERLST